ncbi:hypothetical protein [Mucilaginibacter flavus]|uniref:hypothetical protein n=1 Tax=Mucilaginibacter flavus TaxID=931504 RepID=UPI0025B28192|nr:hypothetical protein [Mucilaginibacter flavus]MDN3581074.1 hypothetical protein [Mucilaginibacter flavus]
MIVGIYAEGRADQAVITNILKGALNIDRSDLRYELPEYHLDQTDLHTMPVEQHSSWTVVKKVCEERRLIDTFFDNPIVQESFIVIQIDTAERHLVGYNVTEPVKSKENDPEEYCLELRVNVIDKINGWLENSHQDKIAYAVAIEEIDAWVLTIYDSKTADTSGYSNPKEKLSNEINRVFSNNSRRDLNNKKAFEKYDVLSQDFRKKKKLAVCMTKNESLKLFCESLAIFKSDEE